MRRSLGRLNFKAGSVMATLPSHSRHSHASIQQAAPVAGDSEMNGSTLSPKDLESSR